MKILCEDIHLSYSTIGTEEGCMLSESRNTSQRQQTVYRSGSDSCQRQQSTNIIRQNAVVIDNGLQRSCSIQPYHYEENVDEEEYDEENLYQSTNDPNDIENYNTEFITEDIYSTQDTIEITRAVS
jgi:hypothetical protein